MTAIFITGATGVVGRALIARLPRAQLYCLVRRTPVNGSNVVAVAGDVARPRLGLTRSEYVELAGRIDLVVHAAAITDFDQPQDSIDRTNVEGTRNVIELARTANVPLYYIGTAFSETRTSVDAFGANSYEISKRAAEQVVRSGSVPHVILRPSVVVGDSMTGAIGRFQGFHLLVGLLLRGLLPMVPAAPSSVIDFVPQDLVARITAGLIERGDVSGTHWLTLGDGAMSLQRLVDICLKHATRLTGHAVATPRALTPDALDRLIRPVFLPALPPHLRQMFERTIHMARYFNIDQPFPSSLARLAHELSLGPLPSAELTLARNIDYWAKRTDFAADGAQAMTA